jgi:hypothetical protein
MNILEVRGKEMVIDTTHRSESKPHEKAMWHVYYYEVL